jgi:hypothetical protein
MIAPSVRREWLAQAPCGLKEAPLFYPEVISHAVILPSVEYTATYPRHLRQLVQRQPLDQHAPHVVRRHQAAGARLRVYGAMETQPDRLASVEQRGGEGVTMMWPTRRGGSPGGSQHKGDAP